MSTHERQLRSDSKNVLVVPKTSYVSFGDRAFSHAAPVLWNRLPKDCRKANTLATFKSKLKTLLFKEAYHLELM